MPLGMLFIFLFNHFSASICQLLAPNDLVPWYIFEITHEVPSSDKNEYNSQQLKVLSMLKIAQFVVLFIERVQKLKILKKNEAEQLNEILKKRIDQTLDSNRKEVRM